MLQGISNSMNQNFSSFGDHLPFILVLNMFEKDWCLFRYVDVVFWFSGYKLILDYLKE